MRTVSPRIYTARHYSLGLLLLILFGFSSALAQPLHDATREGDLDEVKRLLAAGTNINTKNYHGDTPLHSMTYVGSPAMAELLIENGADVNAENNNGDTPLHYAVLNGNEPVADVLTANGANVNAKNKHGQTPASLASLTQAAAWEFYMRTGMAAYEQANYAEAEKQLSAALKKAEDFGPQDPRLAGTLNNLAEVYRAQGKYTEAEPLYQRAVVIAEKALGQNHSYVARVLANYAALLRKANRDADAEKMEARAKAIRDKQQ